MGKSDVGELLTATEILATGRLASRNVVTREGGIPFDYIQREMTNILMATLLCQNANYREDDKK